MNSKQRKQSKSRDIAPRAPVDFVSSFDDLFYHSAAHDGVAEFLKHQLVGRHPLYLVGMEVPPHKGGPALASLLILSDGRLLGARSRRWTGKQDLNEWFPYDNNACDREELLRYSKVWREKLGDFHSFDAGVVPASQVAKELLDCAPNADYLARGARLDLAERVELSLPWDATATAVMTLAGVVCSAFGFTPDLSGVGALELPDAMKRAMTIAPTPSGDRLFEWRPEIGAQLDVRVSDLLDEAWAVTMTSPRASVVLYRTAAERLIDCLNVPTAPSSNFANRVDTVRRAWQPEPSGLKPGAKARELGWRAHVLACLESARELGNLVHQPDPISISEAITSRRVVERLVEAMLRKGALDGDVRDRPPKALRES